VPQDLKLIDQELPVRPPEPIVRTPEPIRDRNKPQDLEESIYEKKSNLAEESNDHTKAFDQEEFIEKEASIDLVQSNYLEDSNSSNNSEADYSEPIRDKNESLLNLMLAINLDEKHRKELRTILNKTSQGHLAEHLSGYKCKLIIQIITSFFI